METASSEDQNLVRLVKEAKAAPLPRSTKWLGILLSASLIFTGGLWVGNKKATSSGSSGAGSLNFSALSGGGGFPAGGFPGRNRSSSANSNSADITENNLPEPASTSATIILPDDVAGTVVSITAKEIIIEKVDGTKSTYPILASTKYRQSSTLDSKKIKVGDIITLKPDTDKSAKTITLLK